MELIQEEDNKTQVLRDMVTLTNEVVDNLKKKTRKVSKQKLLDVATISSNNDRGVGKIIADTYNSVGKNGIVTVEKSQGAETSFETTNGLKVDRGYSSPLFINNHKKDECILEDVYVLVSDAEISNILSYREYIKTNNKRGEEIINCSPMFTKRDKHPSGECHEEQLEALRHNSTLLWL
jgi:chaperonin GroEL